MVTRGLIGGCRKRLGPRTAWDLRQLWPKLRAAWDPRLIVGWASGSDRAPPGTSASCGPSCVQPGTRA